MLKKSACIAIAALSTFRPALAAHGDVPNLSGTYAYTTNIVCYPNQVGGPTFQQMVGAEKFNPKTGWVKFSYASNYLHAGASVHSQKAVGLAMHYEVLGVHKMTLGGLKVYVQFGAVQNGIATSAYLLYVSSDGSCTIQTALTQITP